MPHYPFFHHVPAEVFCMSGDGTCDIVKICNGAGEDYGCSAGLIFKGFPPVSVADHVVAFGVSFEVGSPSIPLTLVHPLDLNERRA